MNVEKDFCTALTEENLLKIDSKKKSQPILDESVDMNLQIYI